MLIMTSRVSTDSPNGVDYCNATITNSHGDTGLGEIDFSDHKTAIIHGQKDGFDHCVPLFSVQRPKFTTLHEMVIPLKVADGHVVGEIRLRNKRKSILDSKAVSTYSITYEGTRLAVCEMKTCVAGLRWSIFDEQVGEPVAIISEERFSYENETPVRRVVSHHIWAKTQPAVWLGVMFAALLFFQSEYCGYGGAYWFPPVSVPAAVEEKWFPTAFIQACERDEFSQV